MNAKYGLYIKKGGTTKNTYQYYNICCMSIPFRVGGKTKELAKRDWKDEQGEDVYIPSKLMFEAYDAEFEMAYVGQELASNPFDVSLAFEQIDAFKKWLTGNDTESGSGAELKIFSQYANFGRQGCYLMELGDEVPHVQLKQEGDTLYNENVVTFKLKFRVTDPVTNLTMADMESD